KARRGFSVGPETPLEHRTIEGLAVEGRKTSTVIPAGQIGNEQPITITSEEWTSPELHVLVMTHHNDPRSGESSYRLTNIVRAAASHTTSASCAISFASTTSSRTRAHSPRSHAAPKAPPRSAMPSTLPS